jgi:hypothetical protein
MRQALTPQRLAAGPRTQNVRTCDENARRRAHGLLRPINICE